MHILPRHAYEQGAFLVNVVKPYVAEV